MTKPNKEDIIPNGTMRFVGSAYVAQPESNTPNKIGSVIETDDGALLLWLFSYPINGQPIDIELKTDFGAETNEVFALIDHTNYTKEFVIGEVSIMHTNAQMKMFAIPVFPATFMLRPPKNQSSEQHTETTLEQQTLISA